MNKKIVKVCIFDSYSTPSDVIGGNGDAILDNILKYGVVDEHLETGEHYLDATFLVDDKGLWKHIQEESILKVSVDYGEEYFRIAQIKSTSNYITVVARQETIHQTLHMWLTDVRPENQTGQGALSWMKDYAEGPKHITVLSDIPTISTAYYMDMNMYQALHDCDQSFLNRWGGEIQRRGYTLRINQRIGTHRGVQIRSNKNLTGFEADTNIDKVFTRLKPKGYDGITIDGYVDSPLISNYPFIKTDDPKYDDVRIKDGNSDEGFDTLAQAQEELIRRAQLEFSQNNIDKIKADYIINFLQLEKTEEYKDYVVAERVFLGDEVDVYEETLGINITVRAIRRSYDILRQRAIEIELSNEVVREKPPSIEDIIDKVEGLEDGLPDSFENILNQAKDEATNILNNGIKDSYVVVRKNEILIMDTTDINTATNVWRWNRGGLGFSYTGYYGQYGTAITNDGKIVADFITTGILNAGIIKTGKLQNSDGSFVIDLERNTVEIKALKDLTTTVAGKIGANDVSTIVKQNATSWGVSINGKLSGTNYTFDGNNFSIGKTNSGDKAEHNNQHSKWMHSDGSYTQADATGFKKYESGTGKTYHYYLKEGTALLSHNESVYIDVPNHILAKKGFTVTIAQLVNPGNASTAYMYSLNNVVVSTFVHNGKLQIQAFLRWTMREGTYTEEGGLVFVHYLITG